MPSQIQGASDRVIYASLQFFRDLLLGRAEGRRELFLIGYADESRVRAGIIQRITERDLGHVAPVSVTDCSNARASVKHLLRGWVPVPLALR